MTSLPAVTYNRLQQQLTANVAGVNLKQGYNGDLTSKQAGSIAARWST